MAANILNLPTEETLQAIASSLQTMQGNVSGVKGNVEVTYRTGQVNLTAANIGALPSDTVYVSSVNGGSGAVTGIATQQELNEVRTIAEGAGAAMSFSNYASLVSDFNNATDDDYKLGQSIYINTLNVPDLWIYEVSDVQILYYYTTDEAFTDLLKQQGYVQIGYYKVAALETEKVDLTNYATLDTTQTFTGTKSFTDFSLINDYTNGKTLASYLSDVYTKTESDEKYVDLTSDQTLSGKKKFTSAPEAKEIIFRNNVSSPTGSYLSIQNDNGYNAKIRFNNRGFMFTAGSVYPSDTNVMDFGATTYLWKNIYLSGNLSDGTNSVSVADIANGTFNVINATDIAVSNILTQAQIDVITNGKPTIIKGTFLDYDNPILCSVRTASNYGNRSYVGAWLGSKQTGLATYAVFTIMNTGLIKIEKALIYFNLQASNEMMAYFGDVTASRNLYFNKGYSTGTTLQLGWNNGNIAIESTASTFKVACDNFISRNGTNSSDIGSSTVKWKDLYLSGHLSDGNNANYGLTLPDTTNYAANKEIAIASSIGLPKVAAPASNTLTDAEFENFKNGCVIDGTYNGCENPIIVPVGQHSSGTYYGCIIGQAGAKFDITGFEISSSKVLTIRPTLIDVGIRNNTVSLPYNLTIKGKDFPAYPSSPSNAKVLTYGTNDALSWGNIVPTNAYATNNTTQLEFETINNISISTDTTYTLATAPTNTYPEYKANITNTDASNAITITLPSGTIVKAENGITVSSNTFTIPADTTVVMSLQDDLALVMIKG